MKKILFAISVFVYTLLIAISSNAQKTTVPDAVQKSFNEHFKNATIARWMPIRDSYIACYTQGKGYNDAYFTDDGEFKGVGHHITTDLLPMHVQAKLDDSYAGYEITELYQFDCVENGICFFAVLKNQKSELILKLNTYGDVAYSKKTRIKTAGVSEPMIASKENTDNKANKANK
jgi:hypothetical protein